jgi:hypothetical protein
MERSESDDFHIKRPELDKGDPARLFTYATSMQRWIHDRSSREQIGTGIDFLAEELTHYVANSFDQLPELTVRSADIMHTRSIVHPSSDASTYVIKTEQLPQAQSDRLFREPIIGQYYGFHRGQNNDLRVYISSDQAPLVTNGGIFTPLLSVGIDDADIQFTQFETDEKLKDNDEIVTALLEKYNQAIQAKVEKLLVTANDTYTPIVKKLQDCSIIIAEIERDENVSQVLIDALLEYVLIKFGFESPQDIEASAHRIVITQKPIFSHRREGRAEFTNVIPQLGLIGESADRSLAVLFFHEDKPIQILAKHITAIHKFYKGV